MVFSVDISRRLPHITHFHCPVLFFCLVSKLSLEYVEIQPGVMWQRYCTRERLGSFIHFFSLLISSKNLVCGRDS